MGKHERKNLNHQTTMKTIIPLLAMMFLVGCGNNSMNQSSPTNSAASEPPAGSNNNTNSPAVEMKALDTGWLPICEHDRLIGTVTDRDITIRAVAGGFDPNITAVRQVMSRDIVYCLDDQNIESAAQIMEEN